MKRYLKMEVMLCIVLCLCLPVLCCAQEQQSCYGPGDVAGIIIAAIVVTLVLVGLALAAAWFRRKPLLEYFSKGGPSKGPAKDPGIPMKPKAAKDDKFAFDNPYFKEDDHHHKETGSPDAAEKGQANGKTTQIDGTQQNGKIGDGIGLNGKVKKGRMNIPFSSVFSLQNKKGQPRTMDDSCLTVEPERLVVPLRGHDFTGLGFNICGNMRDGIFVKDVLHRGPASESGKIKAGDRIIGVTVSFSKMVYEDALTILSYASPYDVQLELEKPIEPTNSRLHPGPPSSLFLAGLQNKRLGSSSFTTGTRLFHPLYRSQSIDDLTQIGKDGMHSPKRSQSVGLTVLQRSRSGQKNSTSSDESRPVSAVLATGSLNERMLANAIVEEGLCKRALESLRETRTEEGSPGRTTDSPKIKSYVPWSLTKEICLNEPPQTKEVEQPVPESHPKKVGKRKAPAPPKPGVSVETEAQVHHTDDSSSAQDGSSDTEEAEKDSDSGRNIDADSLEGAKPKLNGRKETDESSDDDSLDDGEDRSYKKEKRRRSRQRKSSSLGDLTSIEEAISKHSSTMAVLERAVSLDLGQPPVPEGTLGNIPTEGVECLIGDDPDAKPFQQLISSTPVSGREFGPAITNLTRSGIKPPRRDCTSLSTLASSELSMSSISSISKARRGILLSDDSVVSPLRSDLSSSSEEFPRSNGITSPETSPGDREIIEITENELDDVMMSHRQFLLKQAKVTGVYSSLNPTRTGTGLSFESWSYDESTSNESSPTRAAMNGSSSYESSDYSTAFDSSQTSKSHRSPMISQITLRSPDSSATRTVLVSGSGMTPQESFSASGTPPPRLESPN